LKNAFVKSKRLKSFANAKAIKLPLEAVLPFTKAY